MKPFLLASCCLLLGLGLSGCGYRASMGQKILVMSATGPAGAAIGGSGMISGRKRATPSQRASGLRLARTADVQLSPEVRQKLLRRGSPYIAVRVNNAPGVSVGSSAAGSTPSYRHPSAPSATGAISVPASPPETSVMIYDIETNTFATDTVFELRKEPTPGKFVEFDTYFTHYVGDLKAIKKLAEEEKRKAKEKPLE